MGRLTIQKYAPALQDTNFFKPQNMWVCVWFFSPLFFSFSLHCWRCWFKSMALSKCVIEYVGGVKVYLFFLMFFQLYNSTHSKKISVLWEMNPHIWKFLLGLFVPLEVTSCCLTHWFIKMATICSYCNMTFVHMLLYELPSQ